MIRKLLAALFVFAMLGPMLATAAPPDLPERDSVVTPADVADDAPASSPMLATASVLGVAGIAGGSLLSKPETIPAPPPVTGYRQLTAEECALMNEAKAAVNAYGAVLDKLAEHPDTDKRWLAIAKTDAQTSCMAACRAITRPTSFA